MLRSRFLPILRLLLIATTLPVCATRAATSLRDYFLPEPQALGLSPDGAWYAAVIPEGNGNTIYTRQPAGTLGFKISGIPGQIDQLLWVANAQFAVRTHEGSRERIRLMDPSGRVAYDFTPPEYDSVSLIGDQPLPAETGKLIFTAKRSDKPHDELFALTVPKEGVTSTFETTRLVENRLGIQQWLFSPRGALLGGVATRGARSVLYLAEGKSEQSDWTEAYSDRIDRMPLFSGYGCPDGFLLAQGYFGGNFSKAVLFDLKKRSFAEAVIPEGESNLQAIYLSPDNRRVDGYKLFGDGGGARAVSDDFRQLQSRLLDDTKVRDAVPVSITRNYERGLLLQQSDRTAPKYWYFDLKQKKAILILDQGEALGAAETYAMKPMGLKARDGVELPCFWTEPPHKSGTSPLVILVPGGPFEGIHRGWSGFIQALASKGVTVLSMNYRGSRGFGRSFYEGGLGHAGDIMINDVEDVLHAVAKSGTTWTKVAVIGTSYGGYLTMRAALTRPSPVNQIVLINPLIDPAEFIRAAEKDTGDAELAKFEQSCWLGDKSIDTLPALSNLPPVKIPIVLYQSQYDERVSSATAQHYIERLTRAEQSARLVTLNDVHAVGRPDSWVAITEGVLKSLNKD